MLKPLVGNLTAGYKVVFESYCGHMIELKDLICPPGTKEMSTSLRMLARCT